MSTVMDALAEQGLFSSVRMVQASVGPISARDVLIAKAADGNSTLYRC
jgi:hypothetical protein